MGAVRAEVLVADGCQGEQAGQVAARAVLQAGRAGRPALRGLRRAER